MKRNKNRGNREREGKKKEERRIKEKENKETERSRRKQRKITKEKKRRNIGQAAFSASPHRLEEEPPQSHRPQQHSATIATNSTTTRHYQFVFPRPSPPSFSSYASPSPLFCKVKSGE
jgi:hypothetical protein